MYIPIEPKHLAPCFDSKFGLVLRGWVPSKIEVNRVPSIHMSWIYPPPRIHRHHQHDGRHFFGDREMFGPLKLFFGHDCILGRGVDPKIFQFFQEVWDLSSITFLDHKRTVLSG